MNLGFKCKIKNYKIFIRKYRRKSSGPRDGGRILIHDPIAQSIKERNW